VTENVKSTKSYKTFCLSSRMILRMRCAFLRACVWPERDSHDRAKTNVGLLACFACPLSSIFDLRVARAYILQCHTFTPRAVFSTRKFFGHVVFYYGLWFLMHTNSGCDDVPVILNTEFGNDELEGGWPS
jgi:hypothetical protein